MMVVKYWNTIENGSFILLELFCQPFPCSVLFNQDYFYSIYSFWFHTCFVLENSNKLTISAKVVIISENKYDSKVNITHTLGKLGQRSKAHHGCL